MSRFKMDEEAMKQAMENMAEQLRVMTNTTNQLKTENVELLR